jgi:2,4-dienoyl-CoA reductase-like NADH-dependent reductase (Old Yellow Enzyme family)
VQRRLEAFALLDGDVLMSGADPWSPLALQSGAVLRNRFLLAPMTTDSSLDGGVVSEDELRYIERRCATEFGAGITSCAYVDDDGRAWRGIGANREEHIESLRRVAEVVRAGGGQAILQLYDSGRLARADLVAPAAMRAPSPIASLRPGAHVPRAMGSDEVARIISEFVKAALRGVDAGFDGIELHGGNHYLLHQFFSPRANVRDDEWGGSADKRMNFGLCLATAVRKAVGSGAILGYRVNPFEAEPGGYNLADAAEFVSRLCEVGLDYIHISMDDFRKRSPQREDRDWTAPEAKVGAENPIEVISKVVGGRAAVVASGGIRTAADAAEALAMGADLLAVGRAALIDPEWVTKQKNKDETSIRTALPATAERIAAELTMPARMVEYILSRPSWLPREGDALEVVGDR